MFFVITLKSLHVEQANLTSTFSMGLGHGVIQIVKTPSGHEGQLYLLKGLFMTLEAKSIHFNFFSIVTVLTNPMLCLKSLQRLRSRL